MNVAEEEVQKSCQIKYSIIYVVDWIKLLKSHNHKVQYILTFPCLHQNVLFFFYKSSYVRHHNATCHLSKADTSSNNNHLSSHEKKYY